MPKQTETSDNRNAQLDQLANTLAHESAVYELRLANYFVPYGFNPEVEDITRVQQLLDKYGSDITAEVFGQASPNLQQRVAEVVGELAQRQGSLDALITAGAQVTATNEDLHRYAVGVVFNNAPMRRSA